MTIQQKCELALQHHQAGRLREAEALYREVLTHQPNHADALHLLGVVTSQAGRHAEAIDLIRRAIAVHPTDRQYHINLALVYRRTGQPAEAAAAYQKAIALAPKSAKAHSGLGIALGMLGRHADAVASLRYAIDLAGAGAGAGATAEMYGYFGTSLAELARLDEAAAAFRQSLALNPSLAESYIGVAHVQWRTGLVDESIETMRAALRIRPQASFHSTLLFTLQFSPRQTAESIYQEHRRFDDLYARPLQATSRPHVNSRDPERRLRVGYLSGDFRNHVQGLYTLPLLAAHDPEQVEVFGYSHVPNPDHVTARIRALVGTWRETQRLNDEQVAELIRNDAIDVLVDLNMHMTHARPLVFARKPAPVQVAWLAYPGTTGMSAMDYRLTDPYLDPPGSEAGNYAEETVRLPSTFWCFDPMSGNEPLAELPALAAGHVTFGCLNNFAKVNDGVLALWSRVMTSAPNSRMLMLVPEGQTRQRVLDCFAAGGVDASRVEFLDYLRRRDYLRTYDRIDIALDTVPYNGHTTSMDAMWMGVPVVTLIGPTVAGRAGWSQLNNLQLTELAASDDAGFVRIASELAADLPRLRGLRQTLRERMRASPLIDATRFARDMEAAFRTMWRRWCSSDAPAR